MIEVRVRNENEVDLGQFVGRERALHQPHRSQRAEPKVHADARIQRGVGQDANAVEIDQDRRVSEPGERHRVVGPRGWSRLVRRRWDVTTDLLEALPQKPRAPR